MNKYIGKKEKPLIFERVEAIQLTENNHNEIKQFIADHLILQSSNNILMSEHNLSTKSCIEQTDWVVYDGIMLRLYVDHHFNNKYQKETK